MQPVTTIGLDIAKSVFQAHGIDIARFAQKAAAVDVLRLVLRGCRPV
jgi:transposase